MGDPVLSVVYIGIESEHEVETLERVIREPEFVIIVFAPSPKKLWRKFKGWMQGLWKWLKHRAH